MRSRDGGNTNGRRRGRGCIPPHLSAHTHGCLALQDKDAEEEAQARRRAAALASVEEAQDGLPPPLNLAFLEALFLYSVKLKRYSSTEAVGNAAVGARPYARQPALVPKLQRKVVKDGALRAARVERLAVLAGPLPLSERLFNCAVLYHLVLGDLERADMFYSQVETGSPSPAFSTISRCANQGSQSIIRV